MDKSKLIKFLKLTASPNDGEALSAIRKANIFLKDNKLNWENLLQEKPTPTPIKFTRYDSPKVEEMMYGRRNTILNEAYMREIESDNKFSNKIAISLFGVVIILIIIIIILLWR